LESNNNKNEDSTQNHILLILQKLVSVKLNTIDHSNYKQPLDELTYNTKSFITKVSQLNGNNNNYEEICKLVYYTRKNIAFFEIFYDNNFLGTIAELTNKLLLNIPKYLNGLLYLLRFWGLMYKILSDKNTNIVMTIKDLTLSFIDNLLNVLRITQDCMELYESLLTEQAIHDMIETIAFTSRGFYLYLIDYVNKKFEAYLTNIANGNKIEIESLLQVNLMLMICTEILIFNQKLFFDRVNLPKYLDEEEKDFIKSKRDNPIGILIIFFLIYVFIN